MRVHLFPASMRVCVRGGKQYLNLKGPLSYKDLKEVKELIADDMSLWLAGGGAPVVSSKQSQFSL